MARDEKLRDLAAIRKRLIALVAVVLVIAVTVSWIIDPDAFALFRGDLHVQTDPQGAEVFIDGESRGVTPVTVRGIPEGPHVVKLTHRFHEDAVQTVDIVSNTETRIDHAFSAAQGTLQIISNPTNALIRLNGEAIEQTTPATLTDLPTGAYQLTVDTSHHRDVTRTVDVLPNKVSRETFELQMAPWGTLTVNVRPAGSRVSFIDLDTEYQPGVELPIGEYAIALSRSGYPTQQHRVRVNVGDNSYSFRLEALQVPLRVTTTPANAVISVQYQFEGASRVHDYTQGMQVNTGNVTVVARATGYRTQRRTVRVGDQGASVNLALQRFDAKAGDRFSDPLRSGGKGPELVVVGPGEFRMGDITGVGAADERPVHTVVLTQPFAIGIYEVTRADYGRFLTDRGESHPQSGEPQLPVADLNQRDVEQYLDWLSEQTGYQYRLPSEAEWEYAARAGSEARYPHGDDISALCDYANIADQSTKGKFSTWDVADCDDGFVELAPVGSLKANAFGLHDVGGNVTEWVADCWSGNYANARGDEVPYSERGSCHTVYRGGSWDSNTDTVRVSYRSSSDRGSDDRGLRVVREL